MKWPLGGVHRQPSLVGINGQRSAPKAALCARFFNYGAQL